MVGGVLLVFAKVFGLLSLGSIPSGSSNPRRFLFPFEGSFFLPLFYFIFLLYGPQVDIPPPPPPSSTPLFFYLPVEWQKVTKRFRPVRLGLGGVL